MNDASSPKNVGRSIEKRIFNHEKSDKKLHPKILNNTGNLQNLQNLSLKKYLKSGQPRKEPIRRYSRYTNHS